MSSEDIERRKRLESAVEDDDWSSVIDGQTKLTEEPKTEAEAPVATIIRSAPADRPPYPIFFFLTAVGVRLPYDFMIE